LAAYAVVRPSQDEDADSGRVGELDAFLGGKRGMPSANGVVAPKFPAERLRGGNQATLSISTDNHRPPRIYEVAGWRREGQHTMKRLGTAWRDLRFRIKL
jgi:hypothetical protein